MNRDARIALSSLVNKVSKVRKWLVFLTVLKGAAAALLLVAVYVCAYAILDHYIHMNAGLRVGAFALLGGAVTCLLYLLTKTLSAHISCSKAASHIESKLDMEQQLVTAIEYYENRDHYPYSKALAEHLVLQVAKSTAGEKFEATVPKWQAWATSAAVLAGLIAGGIFIHSNYVFFSTYLARLARPLDDVAPMAKTRLVCLSGDVAAEQGSKYAVEAEIHGAVPETGKVEIESLQPAPEGETPATLWNQSLVVAPFHSETALPRFTLEPSLDEGLYRYRFTAADATTEWYALKISTLPRIKSFTAEVMLPGSGYVEPYTIQVKNFALDVLVGSRVMLTAHATVPLSKATVTGLDGTPNVIEIGSTDSFLVTFEADRDGKINFALDSAMGVGNDRIPPLEITARPNDPAHIELVLPGGDILVSDVASVPITFEVTDEFGLESVQLQVDIAGKKTEKYDVPLERGAKSVAYTRTLEIEDYDVAVGDSIVYYVEAGDVDIGTKEASKAPAKSDVSLIEIRPYRVEYIVRPGGGGGGGGLEALHDSLRALLEYSRAILKKTWDIARKKSIKTDDFAACLSIKKDVDYCVGQLKLIEEDPDTPFVALMAIADINGNFDSAGQQLAAYKADGAIDPETKAYQALRKLVEEIYAMSAGPPPKPKQQPDRYALMDKAHLKRYDSARVAEETERIADQLEQAAAEEEKLKEQFEHFLAEQPSGPSYSQKTNDERSWRDPNLPDVSGTSGKPPDVKTTGGPTIEGSQPPASPSPSPGTTGGRRANPRERMKMFAARQRALEGKVEDIQGALSQLPQPDAKAGQKDKDRLKARESAASAIDKASETMARAEANLDGIDFTQDDAAGKSRQAAGALDQAARDLEEARDILAESVQNENAPDASMQMAKELMDAADAYERSPNEATKSTLDSAISQAQGQLGDKGSANQAGSGTSGGTGVMGPAPPGVGQLEPPQIARFLAMRFWTIAIEAAKKPSRLGDQESSNVELHKMENDFFARAAQYRREQDSK